MGRVREHTKTARPADHQTGPRAISRAAAGPEAASPSLRPGAEWI